jgi:hypothetical protein
MTDMSVFFHGTQSAEGALKVLAETVFASNSSDLYFVVNINDSHLKDARSSLMMAGALGPSEVQSSCAVIIKNSGFDASVDECRTSGRDAVSGGCKPGSSDDVPKPDAAADRLPPDVEDVESPADATDSVKVVECGSGSGSGACVTSSHNPLNAPLRDWAEMFSAADRVVQREQTLVRSTLREQTLVRSTLSAVLKSAFGKTLTDGSPKSPSTAGDSSKQFDDSMDSMEDDEKKTRQDVLHQVRMEVKRKMVELAESETASRASIASSTSIESSGASPEPDDVSLAWDAHEDHSRAGLAESTRTPSAADYGVKRRRVEEEESTSRAVSKLKSILDGGRASDCAIKSPKVILSRLPDIEAKSAMNSAVGRDKVRMSSSSASCSNERNWREARQGRHKRERHHASKSSGSSRKSPSYTAASNELSYEKPAAIILHPPAGPLSSRHADQSDCDSSGRVVKSVKRSADCHDVHVSKRSVFDLLFDRTSSSDKRERSAERSPGSSDENGRPKTSFPSRSHTASELRHAVGKPLTGSRSSCTTTSSKVEGVVGTNTFATSSSAVVSADGKMDFCSQKSKWSSYSIPRKPTASCMGGARSDVTDAANSAKVISTNNTTMKSVVNPPSGKRNSCYFATGREHNGQASRAKPDTVAPRVQSASSIDESNTKGTAHQLDNKLRFIRLPTKDSTAGSRNSIPQYAVVAREQFQHIPHSAPATGR